MILLFSSQWMFTRAAGQWPPAFFKGYTRSVTKGDFEYHSPEPGVDRSLLLRSVDSSFYISWETEAVPESFNEPYANFIWMFGIDANPESHTYKLYLNGIHLLTFENPVVSTPEPWTVKGTQGASLAFRTTLLDKYNDPMGYAVLRVPSSLLAKGRPQVIRVVGESAGSRVWYMTFEAEVTPKLEIIQEEAIIKKEGKEWLSLVLGIVHLGERSVATIDIGDRIHFRHSLDEGYNRIPVLVPASRDTSVYRLTVKAEKGENYSRLIRLHPVRKWVIYLVQHTHTDIGYTRPQTEILPEHLRYIDYSLDYCDQTDSLAVEARFRWTCETSWAVREYLRTRPSSQVDRLRRRVKEGRIEITGLFLNSSDLADEASLAVSLQPVREFRENGLQVRAAMQDDINGVPWCLTDYLSGCGIRYLNMGQNIHRAQKPFDRPTIFWWESPSGKRLLVNRPEHYMWANQLGILTGLETLSEALFRHLDDIMAKGYSFDHYAIQFSGYLTDNSPPSTTACRIVKEWNEKYAWPKLQLATIGEFFTYMEKEHSRDIPVVRGAWPDWWMDGFGSAAIPTAFAREAHADFIANDGLMAITRIAGITLGKYINDLRSEVADEISFYDEHTFGAAESITDPLCENSVVQVGEKLSYAWEAVKKNRILREEVMGQIQSFLPRYDVPSITVFNTLGWPRSGTVRLYIDHQVLPPGREFRILDPSGNEVPVQADESREDGTYWILFVKDVPAFGYSSFRIFTENQPRAPLKEKVSGSVLENEWFRIKIDTLSGILVSIFDKELGKEWIDREAPYGFGDFIYERLGKNRHQLELKSLEEYTRTPWKDIRVSGILAGPVWQEITLTGQSQECADAPGITCRILVYGNEKKIGFHFAMKKKAVTDPEGAYVSFPFQLENATISYEAAGGTVTLPDGQIEGASSDWVGMQNFVTAKNHEMQFILCSPQIPLIMPGDINLGRFSRILVPEHPYIYSWVLNNYWTTNFLASQEGELKWCYELTSTGDTSMITAACFGWNDRIPFLTRVFPSATGSNPVKRSFAGDFMKDVLLVNAKPSADGKGIILHLREITGSGSSLDLINMRYPEGPFSSYVNRFSGASEVNVLEEEIAPLGEKIVFNPFETKFIRLSFD